MYRNVVVAPLATLGKKVDLPWQNKQKSPIPARLGWPDSVLQHASLV
ncbi:hypothetical protein URH17368_1488 [Alicyclobacillus hesperidum URH17-3-68]|nr:hypothetical protein URH17368_1488 [Alicyclobacillus hesperidum URH17-3-68]